jgi:hypothetical protein
LPNSSWEEELLSSESQRLAEAETTVLQLHEGNKKDDITPWLKFTKWLKLFDGKDLVV